MKFIARRGDTFVFIGGYKKDEFTLRRCQYNNGEYWLLFNDYILVNRHYQIKIPYGETASYQDIQTAICMVQMLLVEGVI